MQDWRRCNEWISKRESKLREIESIATAASSAERRDDRVSNICQELDEELLSFGTDFSSILLSSFFFSFIIFEGMDSSTGTESDAYRPLSGRAVPYSGEDFDKRHRSRGRSIPVEPNFRPTHSYSQVLERAYGGSKIVSNLIPETLYGGDKIVSTLPPPESVFRNTLASNSQIKRELKELTNTQRLHEHVYDSHAM